MEVKNVSVVGAGTMGNGIAQVFAQAGYSVKLIDVEESFLERARATIEKNLDRMIKKEILSAEQKESVLSNISTATSLDDTRGSDIVVEAIFEDLGVKAVAIVGNLHLEVVRLAGCRHPRVTGVGVLDGIGE